MIYQNEAIAFIVQLKPSGFMILPRCSELAPVKFISFSGNYEEIRSHPFINAIKDKLLYTLVQLGYSGVSAEQTYDSIDTSQKNKNEGVWNNLLLGVQDISASSVSAVPPLLQSTWSQGTETLTGDAYNMYTPTIDGLHAYTGCSATAQAQVMFFWKHPIRGKGSNSYQWNGQVLGADFAHPYYWNNMVDHYSGGESAEQKDAVARLMSDVGISIDMHYALGGSGAMPNANNSLTEFFMYSPEIKQENRSTYADWTDWFYLLKDQMDKGWPCIMGIFKPYSGHAVVVDGYRIQDSINQVHVNMGWGGYADNYYSLDDIYGYGSALRDLAIVNIHPSFNSRFYVCSGNDFDGDGRSDIALWRPSNGYWYIMGQGSYHWGTAGDIPVPADYNADGRDEPAVFRPGEGTWYVYYPGTGAYDAWQWGQAGDIPVPGDYDHDGYADVAVYRPPEGMWYIRKSSDWGMMSCKWGTGDDIAVPGDYDQDGYADVAVYRPSAGMWYIRKSSDWAMMSFKWGTGDDIPVPNDYDGDGKTDIAVWRPSNGYWYIMGQGDYQWGTLGDVPVGGDYNGDHLADLVVWRPGNGFWHILGQGANQWGASSDMPLGKNK